MGARIRALDWASHPLGPTARWAQSLCTVLRVMLGTAHPVFIFWGTEHFCFYNDAYRRSMGPEKHPAMLGARGREFWNEIWDTIGPQIDSVMAGGEATWHEDHLVPITRFGRREDVYWTYSLGPSDDRSSPSGIGGVLVICTETTAKVLAQRTMATEAERLRQLFEQAPSFMAALRGPEHRFASCNEAYRALTGYRDLIGRTISEAIPEAQAQGCVSLLDRVYASGEAYIGRGGLLSVERPRGSAPEDVYVDFIYHPLRGVGGHVEGILVIGHDVTALHRTMAVMRANEERLRRAVSSESVGVLNFRLDGAILDANAALQRLAGYSLEQFVGLRTGPC